MQKKIVPTFPPVTTKQWKQQIQFELDGVDYNEAVVWESPEGIKVKPFYHGDEALIPYEFPSTNGFSITQNIYVYDVKKSNESALDVLQRGAESIRFTLERDTISIAELMQNLPNKKVVYYMNPLFLSVYFLQQTATFAIQNDYQIVILQDPIGQLTKEGNWFASLEKDFIALQSFASAKIPFLSCKLEGYQNAGATCVQQLAYGMAHLNEYLNRIDKHETRITFEVSVGTNYFFEIAKLRALRLLFNSLIKAYNLTIECHIIATPTKRNKTLYDYNVNMLRTTTECMSAVLGGADAISNLAYDAIYHKDNEFGTRIARNQLLILKKESYLDKVTNPADGAYYIETLTEQLAEKALELFKDIEANGGLISQLIAGTIQRKINESAQKEQDLFDAGKEVLLGTNKYPNKNDRMANELELFPFVKNNPRRTWITPIIEKRLSEQLERDRLAQEQQL